MTRDPSIPRIPSIPRPWIVAALVRLYPAAWRLEYGSELADILEARPLGPRVIADVLWNAFRQRIRTSEPSTILGGISMFVVLAGFVLGPVASGSIWKIVPGAPVQFMAAGIFALLQAICGCWTQLRGAGAVHRSGLAAMRTCFIGGIPFMVAALLIMSGLLDLKSSDTTLPLAMLIAPLARLPDAWIWGALGGLLAKRFTCRRAAGGAGSIGTAA